MRPTFIVALVIAATLHVSGASLPSANNPNAVVKNDASPATTDLIEADGGRMLRRVEKDEDDIGEERWFSLTELLKKIKLIDPAKAARKAKNAEKIRKTVKSAGDFQDWINVQNLKIQHGIK